MSPGSSCPGVFTHVASGGGIFSGMLHGPPSTDWGLLATASNENELECLANIDLLLSSAEFWQFLGAEVRDVKTRCLVFRMLSRARCLVIMLLLTGGNKGEDAVVNKVSGAHFSAPARKQFFIELPDEDKPGGEQTVGELNFSMYWPRDAAHNRGEEGASTMEKIGFARGTAPP